MTTNYMADVWPQVVRRRYALGGHMIVMNPCDVEVLGELVHFEPGDILTEYQALVFDGDVLHEWRDRSISQADALETIRKISRKIEAMG